MTRSDAADREDPDRPVLPAYGRSSLADLLPSVGAHLRIPGFEDDIVGLPGAERYVVVLVDGLGWPLLHRFAREAPFLASLLGEAQQLTVGAPSTTATSLTSLGTGLPPGQHGIVGFTSRVPATGELLNALTWESDLLPQVFQPRPTCFERARDAGIAVSSVALERFAGTGLTEAGLRGATFLGFPDERDTDRRIDLIATAARRGRRSLVYAYERSLDHAGHQHGAESSHWLTRLHRVDAWCEQLRDALTEDVVLLITGDHGMINSPAHHRITAEDDPSLMAGVNALAGEGRFRHLYVDSENPAAVTRRWTERLGELAWVRQRDDAIDEGWFGPVADDVTERLGHVLVAMRSDWAVLTRDFPREHALIGMHGSLTPAEMYVPLLRG